MTEPVRRFHPPLPAAVRPPGRIAVEVLTPDATAARNARVAAGEAPPYVYFALAEQDWLTLGRWQQDVLRYVEQLRAVVEFYRAGDDLVRPAAGPAP